MSKMAMDALNRGWSYGLATGRVQPISECDIERQMAEENAPVVRKDSAVAMIGETVQRSLRRIADVESGLWSNWWSTHHQA